MFVGCVLAHEGTVNVIRPHRSECAHVARHPRHESCHQRGNSEPEQPRTAIARQHQRQHFVVAVLAGLQAAGRKQVHRQHRQSEQSGQNDDQRHRHLEERSDDRGHLRRANIFCRKHALHHQKVCRPISHGLHRTQAKHNADPVDAHGIVGERSCGRPHVGEILPGKILMNPRHHSAPSAGLDQPENRDEQRSEPDQEKLQHFIEDGRKQSAGCNINPHRQR